MTTPTKERVRKHRSKLQDQHCRRLEVWIAGSLLDDLRAIASYRNVSRGELVQEALQGFVTGHAGGLALAKNNQKKSRPPSSAPFPLDEWLSRARPLNPGYSDVELAAFYDKKYGLGRSNGHPLPPGPNRP